MIYTYKRRPERHVVNTTSVNGASVKGPKFSGWEMAWVILNPEGKKIAEATSEKQASFIVLALTQAESIKGKLA